MSNELEQYLSTLHRCSDPTIEKIKSYAKEHRIPILQDTSMEILLSLLRIKRPEAILEIGTAIGYSAIRMAKTLPNSTIVSVDIDEERLSVAKDNLLEASVADRVVLIHGEAVEQAEQLRVHAPYDFIFIDAAKGQYQRYFETFQEMLASDGIILSDNVLYRGMVAGEEPLLKRYETAVKKLRLYNEFLANHPDFDTTFYPVGDGLAVSIKKN